MATPLKWTKTPAGLLTCQVGQLALRLEPKPDGRWAWQVTQDGARAPMATGVVTSLGAAKSITAQFAQRCGLV